MLEIFSDVEVAEESENEYPQEYGIDFSTGALTGKIVSGVEALKVWCWFALRIERYRFRPFLWDYGSEVFDLYGKTYGFDYVESEVRRMISDCVCAHPNIAGCENFVFENSGSTIKVTFSIITDFGKTEIEFEEENFLDV